MIRKVTPPMRPAAPADALLDAIGDELSRHGNTVRVAGPGRLAFDGGFPGMGRSGQATNVAEGMVTFDPADPSRGISLELRLSPFLVLGPLLFAAVAVLVHISVATRMAALLAIAAVTAGTIYSTWEAYEEWIEAAVRRAGKA